MFAQAARSMLVRRNGLNASNTLIKGASIAVNSNQLQQRNFATLILAEHFEGKLNSQIGSCLTAANDLNDKDVSSKCRFFVFIFLSAFRLMSSSTDLAHQ